MDTEQTSRREAIAEEAALWVVRLSQDGASAALQAEFEDWRAQGPEYELAYQRMSYTWERTAELPLPEVAPAARRGARKTTDHPAAPARRLFIRRAAAAGAAIAAGGGGVGFWLLNSGPAYATAIGERRLVILDGAHIELNTNSRLKVHNGLDGRMLDLHGEALFEAPRAAHPLVVRAGGRTMKAMGAVFNVRTREQGVDVLVSKGVVDVAFEPADPTRVQRLTAGMLGEFNSRGASTHAALEPEIERTLAWRYGAIVLDGETLAQAVAEFNRYNIRQIAVADPTIANLKLGGYFRSGDLDVFLQALKTSFDLNVVEGDRQTLYLSRVR